ncbi:dihydrofolate reductase family protein [Prauserella muralis]|uniref:Deaminase n=1 Tax=Prauserella muralis TaxID=588067 RepID=A0A2V4ANI1_9PSEU|nr:dihydrofolate reductase family protein [Prauserella muralis]PXY22253.1 deaminase [Prauserella muralis]TWE27889.1 dihydrofolate reductase [Prauserella muralis]
MRTLMVTAFLSLDGVVQSPGGPGEDRDGGFEHGGWAVPYLREEAVRLMTDVVGRAGALLLGRRTYDIFAASWPLAGPADPIGARMNALPKYVASRSPRELTWSGATLLTGDLGTAVGRLKRDGEGELQVHGSGELVQTLLGHDLVDELHLLTLPVLVGGGKRLFGAGTLPAAFALRDCTALGTGAVVARYCRAGELGYGAMGPETGNW